MQKSTSGSEYQTEDVSRKYVDTFSLTKKSLVMSELRGGSVLDDVSEESRQSLDGAITLPSITHQSTVNRRHLNTMTLQKMMVDSDLHRSRTKAAQSSPIRTSHSSNGHYGKTIFQNKPGQQFSMQLMPMLRHRSLNKTPSDLVTSYNVNVHQQQPSISLIPQKNTHQHSTTQVLRVNQRSTQNKPRKEKALKAKRVSQHQLGKHKKTQSTELGSNYHVPSTMSTSRLSQQCRSGSRQSSTKRKQFKILAAALHAPKKENRPDEPPKPLDRKTMTREAFARAILQSNCAKQNQQ